MASSQHRRVFVGNIPYDATEEQLIQICEEVGPVVSFRLVVDRETGKPKGYGFCEYKDEETALSARRNLQGYEINGRQLRVDFAENDKGSDRNREQGRGGPGASTIADVNKQVGGPAVVLDATLNQQIGLPLAMTAASVMAGALGGSQGGGPSNSNGPPQQPLLGNDPLTTHLAKMSKSQLIQVMSEMKVLATQNYHLAQQLLVVCPQLPKALFQAQIMLGMVTPQMLQMPNIRSASVPFSQTSLQGHQNQQSTPTTIHGLPPMAPLTSAPQNSLVSNQFPASIQFPTQARAQVPNLTQKGPQENLIAVHSIANTLPSARPQPLGGMPSGPSMRPVQAPLLQNAGFGGTGNSGLAKQSVSGGSMLPGSGFQTGSLLRPAALDTNRNAAMVPDGTFAGRTKPNPSTLIGSSNRNDSLAQCGRPSKLVKLENGRASTFSPGDFPVTSTSNAKLPNAAGIGVITASQSLRADEPQNLETQANQVQLLPDIESDLLQQVKNLTPEQLSTLPPEQQQQVLQLQKMLL